MSKADPKGYYACLGLDPCVRADQIRAAYHRCAKQCHPDLNPSPQAKARFQAINEAYRTLSNPRQRVTYDNAGRTGTLDKIDLGSARRRRTDLDIHMLAPRIKGLAQFVGVGVLGLALLVLLFEGAVGPHGSELLSGTSSPVSSASAAPPVLEALGLVFEQAPEPAKLASAPAAGSVVSRPASSIASGSPRLASTENKALVGAWLLRDPPNPKPALNLLAGKEAAHLQEQLIARGYLIGSADGVWGPRSHAALEDFRRAQGLASHDDGGDQIQTGPIEAPPETDPPVIAETRGSGEEAVSPPEPSALHNEGGEAMTDLPPDQSRNATPEPRSATQVEQVNAEPVTKAAYMGAWARSRADCFVETDAPPLAISGQRAESFGGRMGRCEFAQVQRDGAGWRTRARCSADGKSWASHVQLKVTGSTLVWSSERGRATYYRCPQR